VSGGENPFIAYSQVMRTLIASILCVLPLSLGAGQAKADYWNYSYNQIGNYGTGYLNGPSGYQGTIQQNRIGGFINTSYSDNHGSRSSCTTYRIGMFINTNCN
jgi:hypothetical protein